MTRLTREQQIAALEKDWAENPRWKLVKRGYSAADVVRLRGSMQPEYTLAKAGKPEPSYQTVLYQRRDDLPEMSRLFLAMAMCLTHAPEKQIHELLGPPKGAGRWERYWLGDQTAAGRAPNIVPNFGSLRFIR